MKPSKYYIIKKIEELVKTKVELKILDLGSGKSENFFDLIKKYPQVNYTGIEPNKDESDCAMNNLKSFANARIINDFVDHSKNDLDDQFDVVVSLSVLEHVKNLEEFLAFSADALKKEGLLIHLYDLGHSLASSNLKEKLQVMLCANFPKIMPKNKFCAYINNNWLIEFLERSGIKITDITYHNMPDHVNLLKNLHDGNEADKIIGTIAELEVCLARLVNTDWLEKLFFSICVWGKKL